MVRTQGYSLWLMPEETIYRELAQLIKELSEEYQTPVFAPHLTLLGELDLPEHTVVDHAIQLAEETGPFTLHVHALEAHTHYFRSIILSMEQTPELQGAYERALSIFHVPPRQIFHPHLSLVYGELNPEQKHRIIDRIGKTRVLIPVHSLQVMSTDGFVSEWFQLRRFTLGISDMRYNTHTRSYS